MTFRASGHTNNNTRELVKLTYPNQVESNGINEWKGDDLVRVPPVCASTDDKCKIITVSYELRMRFRPNGSSGKEVRIPITIGTIRIREEPSAPSSEKAVLNPDLTNDAPPSYDQLSFAEDGFEIIPSASNLNKDDNGEILSSNDANFKPSYIYFKS